MVLELHGVKLALHWQVTTTTAANSRPEYIYMKFVEAQVGAPKDYVRHSQAATSVKVIQPHPRRHQFHPTVGIG